MISNFGLEYSNIDYNDLIDARSVTFTGGTAGQLQGSTCNCSPYVTVSAYNTDITNLITNINNSFSNSANASIVNNNFTTVQTTINQIINALSNINVTGCSCPTVKVNGLPNTLNAFSQA